MNWLIIIIIAYFLGAIANVVDKILLSKSIPKPAVYAFFVGTLGLVALVLMPFDFSVPAVGQLIVSFLAGLAFTFATLYLFKALKYNDTSRIAPFVGGLSPIFVFLLSFLFLSERLTSNEIFAFLALVAGTVLISLELGKKHAGQGGFFLAAISAFLFAASYTLTKEVFMHQTFISGFVWIRIGAFLGAIILFLPPKNRQAIVASFKKPKQQKKKAGFTLLFGQSCGGLSMLLISYAISLASVSLVNAMQGLQYVFLLFMVFLLSKFHPKILREKMTKVIIFQKVGAIVLVGIGLALLAFA